MGSQATPAIGNPKNAKQWRATTALDVSDPDEALAMASINGLIDIVPQDEFERELRFRIAHGAPDWANAWSDMERITYSETMLTPEQQSEMNQKKWDAFVNQQYDAYWQGKAAEWQDATRRMDAAWGAMKAGLLFEFGGATLAVGGGLAAGRLAAGASSLGGAGRWLFARTLGRLLARRAAASAIADEAAGETVATEAATDTTATTTTTPQPAEPSILTDEPVGESPYRSPPNTQPGPTEPTPEPDRDPWSEFGRDRNRPPRR